jgi:threonyl-tRNA synthetase
MNCPGGCLVYKSRPHSYREFPMRISEFGLVHRYEASGVMHGLVRVRQFTQDDAHIFCTKEQIESEVISVINCLYEMYGVFGFNEIAVALSTKPEKHLGSDEIWDISTNALASALKHKGLTYKINEGEGAFYGPKIEFQVKDCIGRPWQLGTIQLDFSMPQRFELTYTDKDNTEKTPVMIHRAILGSLERFTGILIEHYGGNFPLWLAPEQMRILTISEKTADYAAALYKRLGDLGFRVGIDLSDEKVNGKIVRGHADRIAYMLVVGPKEAETNSVNVRVRGEKDTKTVSVDEFIAAVAAKIEKQETGIELA